MVDVQWHYSLDFHVFSGTVERVITFLVDLHSNFQWKFPMYLHFYEIWRAIFCPGKRCMRHASCVGFPLSPQ